MMSHFNLVAVCHQLHFDNPHNWRSSQQEIFFPPLSHVYGLYVCFTTCYWQGTYVCLMLRFALGVYFRLMQDRQATLARFVPPVAKALAENPVVCKYRYPQLGVFLVLGSTLECNLLTVP
jgi:acyl-CoA synthetase (AMP-forming)/AMP-acid ligase II